ncbi:tumor necrosis factor receptor superfamily member 8-like [Ranitomeya imitator]|uniref:tumor necrosis factor receptor superfamily member 8-like n=1 Tax=Ranitomeya imitator TaxID=111125 RepID=UPI0037E8000D
MFFAQEISVLILITGICQKVAGHRSCQGNQNYNEKENDCCFRCPQGLVTRSTCVKDINKECASCSEPDTFIVWSKNRPTCAACRRCKEESSLVTVQSCTLLTEAICQCKAGYYCHSPLPNTCARCNLFTQCPPGQGVKQKGSPMKNTECEACPSGTFSDVKSTTEVCKPHTDCDKLHLVTTRRGSTTTDALCGGPISSKNYTLRPDVRSTRYVITSTGSTTSGSTTSGSTTSSSTTPHTTTPDTTTSGTFTSITTRDIYETGKRSAVYVVAAIICAVSLLVAFLLYWQQNICNLKLWKNFIQPELVGRVTDVNTQENLLQKENVTPESERKESDGTMEGNHGTQERDLMNNRIEHIYIMNADTVLVGSISEVPPRWRSVMTEGDSRESPLLASHYPEQESSTLSANDLMISIEEEEREASAAKAILEV